MAFVSKPQSVTHDCHVSLGVFGVPRLVNTSRALKEFSMIHLCLWWSVVHRGTHGIFRKSEHRSREIVLVFCGVRYISYRTVYAEGTVNILSQVATELQGPWGNGRELQKKRLRYWELEWIISPLLPTAFSLLF